MASVNKNNDNDSDVDEIVDDSSQGSSTVVGPPSPSPSPPPSKPAALKNDSDYDDDSDDETVVPDGKEQNFMFNGKSYPTYQDMVNAKRKRNQDVLNGLGLGNVASDSSASSPTSMLLQKKKKAKTAPNRNSQSQSQSQSRRSSRLSGQDVEHVELDLNVNHDALISTNRNNRNKAATSNSSGNGPALDNQMTFFNGRVNDGEVLSVEQAIDLNDSRWIHDSSVEQAEILRRILCRNTPNDNDDGSGDSPKRARRSPTSVSSLVQDEKILQEKLDELSIDNEEWIAKVTPDRVYSVGVNPSSSKLIACAGDKQGYVGLWDVDKPKSSNNDDNDMDGVHLFRVHGRPVCCLEWSTPTNMITASYDGTIRKFDAHAGSFEQIFATYDDSDSYYAEEIGYGIDQGAGFWPQYVTRDHRNAQGDCLFVSTSFGTVMHLDLRVAGKEKITFNRPLSDKKINSVSLHPNGHCLAVGGLDNVVRTWDIRKFAKKNYPDALAVQNTGLSVCSSFFSPSGNCLVTTTMADKIEIVQDAHLAADELKPIKKINHNNHTGRWLSTFMTSWHPELDIFAIGSMEKPRRMEIFGSKGDLKRSIEGEALQSVMSRCAFHPTSENLTLVGGNSSGRLVVIR